MPAAAPGFDAFLDQAWQDHADHCEAVAERLPAALPLLRGDDDVVSLAALIHHVHGTHLQRWAPGIDLIDRVRASGVAAEPGQAALARARAALQLGSGEADERAGFSPSEACRVTAMAASTLMLADARRAARLLAEGLRAAAALPDADPGVRALAAQSNNLAAVLSEEPSLDAAQRTLMLDAAAVARAQWQRAGGWREVERAEYRLALCRLAAGDAVQARLHAVECERIVRENGSEPLEVFFAGEVLARCAAALGDQADVDAAVAMSLPMFDVLPGADQAWCRPTLERIAALAAR